MESPGIKSALMIGNQINPYYQDHGINHNLSHGCKYSNACFYFSLVLIGRRVIISLGFGKWTENVNLSIIRLYVAITYVGPMGDYWIFKT